MDAQDQDTLGDSRDAREYDNSNEISDIDARLNALQDFLKTANKK